MKKENTIVTLLIIVTSIIYLFGAFISLWKPKTISKYTIHFNLDFDFEFPEKPILEPDCFEFYEDLQNRLDSVEIEVVTIKLTSLGTYYITNYCPAECGGSWMTSSGATCHRSSYEDRLTIPTTCAIDKSIHDYGDLFYIAEFDRIFIAEDTGSAVKGKHIDLFYENYSDVVSFATGMYEVYSVEYEYNMVPANYYSIIKDTAIRATGWKLSDEMKGLA